ncbi:MAG: Beta-lactamase domain-containing protein [Candidatus Magnetoglobus multicellularis str. Araruama]|uniref:Beta-lactamase domain-containing protein n=1 Tax=Candidatus Magnetoglobus multicellularis str. Araruama TaxID=890399 RepID=A0A1V1PB82_9BACT|nr:MAG: Beta-lactamase domain-containing protein [Candidatus Magnetoglobus multicellularis str. Araruama]
MLSINDLQIKTISENTAATPLVMAEWGLSMEISINPKKILFDTGAGNINVLRHNMMVMKVVPDQINDMVLSHAHQDHTGGLRYFLAQRAVLTTQEISIYCHPKTMQHTYVQSPILNNAYRFFGCPFNVEEIQRYNATFSFSREPVELMNQSVMTSGEIPMRNDYESVGINFFNKNNDTYELDDEMIDDLALFIQTDLGLVIILGCAHRGMINTIHHAQEITGIDTVFMVIGGTHLAKAPQARLDKTIDEIKRLNIKKVGVSHCTGLYSAAYLQRELGPDVFFIIMPVRLFVLKMEK